MANVELNIRVQIEDLQKGLKKVEAGQKKLAAQSTKTHKTMQSNMQQTSGVANQLKGAMTGLFAVGTAVQLAKSIIGVRVEFEKFGAMLKVALGSAEAANREFEKIQQFASNTPFSVRELTDSFVRLVNMGFKPTTKEMTAMGDLAAAMGKESIQLTEAIIDAQTGEFERLKEFGIRASKQGDKVTLSFKGVEKQIDFTADAIRQAVIGYGEMEGVMGTMEEVSATLGGQLSNLSDSLTILANNLGEMGSGEVSTGVSMLKSLTEIVTTLTELKPNLNTDEGVLGFLSKISEGVKTFMSVSTGGAFAGGTFRKLFAETLEGLNEGLTELVENTEDLQVVETDETDITVTKKRIKTLKELQKERRALIAGLALTKKLEKEETEYFESLILLQEESAQVTESITDRLKQDVTDKVDHGIAEEQRLADAKKKINALEMAQLLNQRMVRLEVAASGLDLISAITKENAIIQQTIAVSQAIINGALAVTKIQASVIPPFNIPLIAASVLTTLAQIATIKQQKFERGGFDVLKGRRHAQGGVDIGIGEAEAGEGLAVFNRKATQKHGKFLPAFVKAINENDGELGYSDGAYMINFDDSKSVKELKGINEKLNRPEIRYEGRYRIETRKGQVTRVKI